MTMKSALVLALLFGGKTAFAQIPAQPLLLGTFETFKAYAQEKNGGHACYIVSAPDKMTPANVRRDPAYLFIAHRPKEKIRNEVNLQMGYPLKSDAPVSLEIAGGGSFPLAAYGEGAWIGDVTKQDLLIEALRKGKEMTVKAASKRGTATVDHYSLAGLGPALDRINKECPK